MSRRYEFARAVMDNRQHGKLEGAFLDLWTASAMVAVFDALGPAQRARFDSMPLDLLVRFCLRHTA